MAEHNTLGKAGEEAAVKLLEDKGYCILHRNWRMKHFELDIVASGKTELIVVEVKTRSNGEYGNPEDAVDWRKIRNIVRAADTYVKLFQIDQPIRFDIITAIGDKENLRLTHIEDAFRSPIF